MAGERKAFKDWFDMAAARALASQFRLAWGSFDEDAFCQRAAEGLEGLGFHERVKQFSRALREALPEKPGEAMEVIRASLPPVLSGAHSISEGWLQWPIGQWIADYGFDDYEGAMALMLELTQRFSSEFAVRPFLARRPDETLERLLDWTSHPSEHVRRWCSEGARPRLPWGQRLAAFEEAPWPTLPILEALKDDPSGYVQLSVGNHLNDLGKTNPEMVVALSGRWLEELPGRRKVVERALRTLVKQGHRGALELLGFGAPEAIKVAFKVEPRRVRIGGAIQLWARIGAKRGVATEVLVDYGIHFQRRVGGLGRKVFKWKRLSLPAGETVELTREHKMVETTVRTLNPGIHKVDIQINGEVATELEFELLR